MTWVENTTEEFKNVRSSTDGNTYQVNIKLNGFADCLVKYYPPNISNTGKDKWVYVAETESMTRTEALNLYNTIEDAFGKIKFNEPAQKDVEYDAVARHLINYSYKKMPPFINRDRV